MNEFKTNAYFKYWGKVDRGDILKYHLLPYHCLDVAAVGQILLRKNIKKIDQTLNFIGCPSEFLNNLPFLLALHDIGKFADSFQNIVPELFLKLRGSSSDKNYTIRHDSLGYISWFLRLNNQSGLGLINSDRWFGNCFTGHHGRPCDTNGIKYWEQIFTNENQLAVSTYIEELRKVFQISEFQNIQETQLTKLSWVIAGFSVLCDWLGSNSRYFEMTQNEMPLETYYKTIALPKAESILHNTGFYPYKVFPHKKTYSLFPDIPKSSPLQKYIEDIQLYNTPQLHIIEDVTGSGKTEASIILASKLMQNGIGDGVFMALPTMATANAIYVRMSSVYKKLFLEGHPSLVLSHGKNYLMDYFRKSIIPNEVEVENNHGPEKDDGTAQCSEWFSDNKKKCFLADVGVGTVDQTLLSVLPCKHQSLRLFGLMKKILIIDEVHAYDPYMQELIETLLEFHAGLGGSAIILSATIPFKMRSSLANAFLKGLNKKPIILNKKEEYPLVTSIDVNDLREINIPARVELCRSLKTVFLHTEEDAVKQIIQHSENGKCVCWIRNTVEDVMRAYSILKNYIIDTKLMIFHARFAMGNRIDIENKVVGVFGKNGIASKRSGKILIATQVVEQSLDLDFDEMISDLAPIDLLIQRAGRVHRHKRNKAGALTENEDERGEINLYILSPDPVENPNSDWYKKMFEKGSYVYPNSYELWLTARILEKKGGWKMPDDCRGLIEGVFGICPFEELPEGLEKSTLRAEGDEAAFSVLGKQNCLKFNEGYRPSNSRWLDDADTPTRLGNIEKTICLLKWENENLTFFYTDTDFPYEMSQVRVNAKIISIEVEFTRQLKDSLDVFKAKLKDEGKSSVFVPLANDEYGIWKGTALNKKGNTIEVQYSDKFGLQINKGEN